MATHHISMPSTFGSHKHAPGDEADRFIAAVLDMSPTEHQRRSPLQLAVAVLVHVLLISAAIVAPIYFADNSIDFKAMTTTFLVAPMPPAPPPPPATAAQEVPHVTSRTTPRVFQPTPLVAPRVVPKTIAMASNEPPPLNVGGGVTGGIPGGQLGGILGGMVGGPVVLPTPAKAPAAPVQRVLRVGGDVKPPRLLSEVQPVYPPLARTARVEGQVVIDAVIDAQGNVIRAHAVSGPGLLISAALRAVEQWKYAPTYLNGEPVSLAMNVTVDFHMQANEGY